MRNRPGVIEVSVGDEKAGMDFAHVLDGMFETGFDDLPEAVRREVARRFHPFRWENLSPVQRQTLVRAAAGDASAEADEFSRYWNLYAERADLLRQVSDWWLAATPTATDKATQEDRIVVLRKRVAAIDEAIADVAPASTRAVEAHTQRQTRHDGIALEIDVALAHVGPDALPHEVMAYLANLAGKPGCAVRSVSRDGGNLTAVWKRASGESSLLTMNALQKRLARIRQQDAATTAAKPLRPPPSR